jgi:hypothetical protein
VRALPDLLVKLRAGMQAWRNLGAAEDNLIVGFCGEGCWHCLAPKVTSNHLKRDAVRGHNDAVRVLLARWDDLHPVIEFLSQRLSLPLDGLDLGARRGEHADEARWSPELCDMRVAHLRDLPDYIVVYCSFRRTPR